MSHRPRARWRCSSMPAPVGSSVIFFGQRTVTPLGVKQPMRHLISAVLAVLVGLGSVLVVPAAAGAADGEALGVSVIRYGGADRYETSLQVAEAVAADAGGSLEWVVLVSGRRWTDAVVAAAVAGALGAPVLMTPPDQLRADALDFLRRAGVSKALVVGPDASGGLHGPGRGVEASVLGALGEAGISAERVAGDDLYDTAVAAAGRVTPGALGDLGRTAVIASGEVFADALVAGPFAARGIHPVLLSPPDELHADVAGYLGEAAIDHVVLMGGTAALSEAVEQAVEDLGIEVSRVAGSTRYETATKAAELAADRYSAAAGRPCIADDTIGVARARVPFDSFSAAPLLGRLCAALVLADPDGIPDDTAAYLDAARDDHDAVSLRVFGGDAAVSQAAIDAYLTGSEPDTAEDDAAGEGEDSAASGALPAGACGGAIDDGPSLLVPSTNADDPAWSPDCSRLVYTQDGSLWTVDNDGTDARKLVDHDGAYLYHAVWSPDGTRIAYVSGRNDEHGVWVGHIWTVNADGSHDNQRTEGDVADRWPTWSPDGKRIAYERETGNGRDENGDRVDSDRHIVVMTSFGNKPTALNEGGSWEFSPAWSPDGTQIAFRSDGYLVIADTDGSNARRVNAGVYFYGGLSWSPDGTRIAFVRGDDDQNAIVVADVNGPHEEVIYDEGTRTLGPRWSPDGQRIAFHTIDDDNNRRSYVTGASGKPSGVAQHCRPLGIPYDTTAGFPLPWWAPSATGTVRVAVLFVDFPDAQAAHTTEQEAALGLPWAEEYLRASSYGKLDVEFVPRHEWLRAPASYKDYLREAGSGSQNVWGDDFWTDAVDLVDDEFDFAGFDSLAVILPSTHFSGGIAGGSVDADGTTLPRHVNNSQPLAEPAEPADWGIVAAHELMHNLGLLDMYPYDDAAHDRADPPGGREWIPVSFGLMELEAWFLADASLMLRRTTRSHPDGSSSWWEVEWLLPIEMLAWSRWQLGWLDPSQVHCNGDENAAVELAPVARPGKAAALTVIPLDAHNVIAIESRRKLGYDRGREFTWSSGGTGRRQALITEGVLVYTVDTFVESGELPVKIAGDNGNGQVDGFPVLRVGESVTLHGYTITVTADNGTSHTVTIKREP